LGVGTVVQSSLYKPLAQNDTNQISQIMVSASKFFRRLAQILIAYILVLIFVYPKITNSSFDWVYIATLIVAMSISSFAQYYFGVVNRLLLTADQKGYIQYTAQIITLIANTIISVFLIKLGASIHLVKLTTSLIYLVRPIFLKLYVDRYYSINYGIEYNDEPIKQKWNGVAQHIAYVVIDSTDTIVLTMLSTLENVSIYSVYHLIIYGVKQLFISLTNGVQAMLGELWAKEQMDKLNVTFSWIEWAVHSGVLLIFGCTGLLVLPFVQVYTKGITDAQYIQPVFAYILVLAHASHCLRLPYNMMIFACGHYKQTQWNYIISALLNIGISILGVKLWGLIGVALGTLISMLFQTIWMAWYNSKFLLHRSLMHSIKRFSVDIISVFLISILPFRPAMISITYIGWGVLSIEIFSIVFVILVIINFLFYKREMVKLIKMVYKKVK
jgi:O-antigen/teichoic acid export membrane protein